jgi:outer membrane protein assembly factor BamB
LWKHAAGRGVNGPIAGGDGNAYAAPVGGGVLRLDARSGAVRWSIDLKVPGLEGPAVSGNRVFVGTVDGALHALNARTGRDEWKTKLAAPASTTVIATNVDLYVGTSDGTIHRVDLRNGTVVGSRNLDPVLTPRGVPVRTADSVLVLLIDKSADHRALVALDPALERVRWRVAADGKWSTSRVFVWGDVIVLGTPSGEIVGYCEKTGKVAWSRIVKGLVRAIGGAGDTLLVGTPAGDLYAMRASRSCHAD